MPSERLPRPAGEPDPPSELSVRTIGLAAFSSAVATFLVGRLGLAGTIIGAATFSALYLVLKDVTGRPIARARRRRERPVETGAYASPSAYASRSASGKRPAASGRKPTDRKDVRPLRVVVVGAIAFGIVLVGFSVPEVFLGKSLVSDRRTTFLSSGQTAPEVPQGTRSNAAKSQPDAAHPASNASSEPVSEKQDAPTASQEKTHATPKAGKAEADRKDAESAPKKDGSTQSPKSTDSTAVDGAEPGGDGSDNLGQGAPQEDTQPMGSEGSPDQPVDGSQPPTVQVDQAP